MGMANRRGRRSGGWFPRWGGRSFSPEEELQSLQDQQSWLKEQLEAVARRIEKFHKPAE